MGQVIKFKGKHGNSDLMSSRRKVLEKMTDDEKTAKRKKVRAEIDGQVSRFSKEWKNFKKKVGAKNKNFDPNAVSVAMLRSILAMSIELLPQVEKTFRQFPSERSVYAMVALSNQCREVANELRAVADRSMLPSRIMQDVIEPTLAEMAQRLQTSNTNILRAIRRKVQDRSDRKHLTQMVESQLFDLVDLARESREKAVVSVNHILDS